MNLFCLISIAISVLLILLYYIRYKKTYNVFFSLIQFLVLIVLVARFKKLSVTSISEALLFDNIEALYYFFFYSLLLCGTFQSLNVRLSNKTIFGIFLSEAIIYGILILTNNSRLFYSSLSLSYVGDSLILNKQPAILFIVIIALAFIYMILTFLMIIDNNSNKTIHFSLNLSVIYGYCLLILIVYIFNLLLINNIYISCFIEVVSQAIVIYLADMYANHDIGTYALNTSENGFETGFVIFDADKKLIAYSKNVKEYFPEIKELSVGNKIKSVKGLAGHFLKWLNYFNIKTTNITDIVKTDEVSVRVYGSVKKIDRKKYYYFELSDYTVQQKLINIIGKDNKKLSGTTNHLFDPKLLDKINKDDKVTLENKEVSVSILSASLKDFNTIVNNTESDVMIDVLNKYLSLAEKIIHKYDGIIDRYSGYIISAFWIDSGDGDSAKQAAQASNEIIQESKNLKEEITKLISKELHFAIGLDYGKAILANIGTEKFNNYSLIGDSVNIVVKARNMASNNEIYLTDNVSKYLSDMELKKVDESTYQLVSLDKTNGGK